jgi:hypothetical protein
LPSDTVKHRVLEQLDDILALDDIAGDPKHPPHRPLSDLSFRTRAYATDLPGLCRIDGLTVHFKPVGSTLNGAHTRSRAEGFSSNAQYSFLAPPTEPSPASVALATQEATDIKCAGLDPTHIHFFTARDEKTATEGVWLIGLAIAPASYASATTAFGCTLTSATEHDCRKALGQLTMKDIWSVERCDIPDSQDYSETCFSFYGSDYHIRIIAKSASSGETPISVDLQEVVTIADEVED